MNAAPEWFMSELPRKNERASSVSPNTSDEREESRHTLWGWIAVGVLVICWIAEGALCAARGF